MYIYIFQSFCILKCFYALLAARWTLFNSFAICTTKNYGARNTLAENIFMLLVYKDMVVHLYILKLLYFKMFLSASRPGKYEDQNSDVISAPSNEDCMY